MWLWLLGALGLTGGGIGIAALLGGGPAMLLGAKWLWGWLSHATFLQVVCVALGVALAVDHAGLLMAHRHSEKVQTQLSKSEAGRAADRKAYQKAQAEATAANLLTVEKTKRQQQEITDARVADLNSRLQLIARELRNNPAAKGSAGSAPIPETGPAPCRAFDPTWLCLSPADRLLAAQNEERHDQLITWNEQQSVVDPNAH